MTGDLKIRIRTASGATAVQIVRYANNKRIIVRHVGSAHTDDKLTVLCSKAERIRESLCIQPSLFSEASPPSRLLLMHDVYKGNTFEGHTMLDIVKTFQCRHANVKPIIVGDAAMLSQQNMQVLEAQGYQYIVGARLANTTESFLDSVERKLSHQDGSMIRLAYPNRSYEVVCAFSQKRYKKDKRTFEKQVEKAKTLIGRKEPGKRAKFVKKSGDMKSPYLFDDALKAKAEKLLGIKGYCTNIPEDQLSNKQVIAYYHDLWRVEQTFRMSKTDLRARPIFHYTHDAVKAHVLLCFMSLMMGKFLEIKTGLSIRRIRDILWSVHEAQIVDALTGEKVTLRTNLKEYYDSGLQDFLKKH